MILSSISYQWLGNNENKIINHVIKKVKNVEILEDLIIDFSKGYCEIRQRHPFEDKDQQKGPTLPPFS